MRFPRRLRPGEEATLVEHLDELRSRLIVSLLTVSIGFGVAYGFHGRLIRALEHALPADRRHLVTFGVAEPFLTSMWVSIWAGLALALPVVLWQIWSFLAPAVAEHSQRILVAFVAFASGLALAGIAFGYYLALPAAVHFLTHYDDNLYRIQIRARDYITFSMLVLVACGVVFELPIFVLALVRLGVLTTQKLRRNRRLGYVIVFAIAVALPGVDPVTTTLEAIPMLVLYELTIWLSVVLERRWRPNELTPATLRE
ncbi:MAG: twin-arginine translocase subunit TatC [Gaiellaceae bacterium]